MKTSNQLNHQRPTKWPKRESGGSKWSASCGASSRGSTKFLGANPPQLNPPAGGNPAPAVNVQPIGNSPYVAANQFPGFPSYNQFRPQVHQGVGVNFAGPHINQFVGIGGWNNLGGNANLNNQLLGNQDIDRGAIEQMIKNMVPHARRIGRPVYRRPYPERFDQEEFPRGFKILDFALFSGDGLQ
ncbi:unnamed protein product [Prunus armeniaca]